MGFWRGGDEEGMSKEKGKMNRRWSQTKTSRKFIYRLYKHPMIALLSGVKITRGEKGGNGEIEAGIKGRNGIQFRYSPN